MLGKCAGCLILWAVGPPPLPPTVGHHYEFRQFSDFDFFKFQVTNGLPITSGFPKGIIHDILNTDSLVMSKSLATKINLKNLNSETSFFLYFKVVLQSQ